MGRITKHVYLPPNSTGLLRYVATKLNRKKFSKKCRLRDDVAAGRLQISIKVLQELQKQINSEGLVIVVKSLKRTVYEYSNVVSSSIAVRLELGLPV